MPMSHIKRVGLSLLCALASELLVGAALTARNRGGFSDVLGSAIGLSIFVIPGWLLSLPAVLVFDRADGWRFWVLGIYGTFLGPTIILAWAIACKVTERSTIEDFGYMGGIAFVIALLSTALYLYVFKSSSPDSIEQAQP
jgi:ABC-type dipeptide/oligopeptide/nickel transport system permease component